MMSKMEFFIITYYFNLAESIRLPKNWTMNCRINFDIFEPGNIGPRSHQKYLSTLKSCNMILLYSTKCTQIIIYSN